MIAPRGQYLRTIAIIFDKYAVSPNILFNTVVDSHKSEFKCLCFGHSKNRAIIMCISLNNRTFNCCWKCKLSGIVICQISRMLQDVNGPRPLYPFVHYQLWDPLCNEINS